MTTMLKMALERAGFTIDIFNDPVLALQSFKPNVYDLVGKKKHCELNRDLFLEMPLPIKEIINEIKKRT
jgi:hypothetical protein